jgi:peptidoglycan LD-endopeptidase LytH
MTSPTLQRRLIAYGTVLDAAHPRAHVTELAPNSRSQRVVAAIVSAALGVGAIAIAHILPGRSVPGNVASRSTDQRLVFPVDGKASFVNTFGAPRRDNEGTSYINHGVDIFAPAGTRVRAMRTGTISHVGETPSLGHHVWIIDEDSNRYLYAHVQKPTTVRKGQLIKAGKVLGQVASPETSTAAASLYLEIQLPLEVAVNPYPILRSTESGAVAVPTEPQTSVVVEVRNRAVDTSDEGIVTRLEGEVVGRSRNTNPADMTEFMSVSAPIQALGPPEGAPGFEARTYVWTTSIIALRQRHCGTSAYATFLLPAAKCALPVPIPRPDQMSIQGNVISFTEKGKPLTKASPIYRWLTAKVGSTTRAAKANFVPVNHANPSEWYWFGVAMVPSQSRIVGLPMQ